MDNSVEPNIQTEATQNPTENIIIPLSVEPNTQTESTQNPTENIIIPLSNNKGIIPKTEPSSARIGEEFQAQIPALQSGPATCHLKIAPAVPITWAPQNTPLPYSEPSRLTQQEKDVFLAGFYIFKKKLNFLTRFVMSEQGRFGNLKKMGDVLRYYYTEFYKSEGYNRVKSKKCVIGTDIFTGWRQLEVLSRLESLVPVEQHGTLKEVFNQYNDKSTSFDQFILSLASLTGPLSLLQSLAIGSGRADLTRVRPDPTRTRKAQTRPDIPSGRQWAGLGLHQVVGYLNGGVRLSKARSNDLFWEAIWPRLLVQGWTSYQPKDHTLVFLIPGIQIPDFSRENLVKGIQYFDSISDLLSKVASDPDSFKNTENALDNNNNNISSGSNNNNNGKIKRGLSENFGSQEVEIMMKFTIVDTSCAQDKIRSLRTLPIYDVSSNSVSQSQSDTSASVAEGSEPDRSMKNEPAGNNNKNKKEGKLLKKPKDEDFAPPVHKRRRLVACKKEKENYENAPRKQACEPSIDLDLNLPDVKSESELNNQHSFTMDLDVKSGSEMKYKEPCEKDSNVNMEKEGSNVENNRRHGTRNRPPTAKALEALAFGLIGTAKKKKNREIICRNSDRPMRRARKSNEKNFEGHFGQEKNDLSVGLFACTEIQSDASWMSGE